MEQIDRIHLNSLNAKQKSKEFKSTLKLINAKDLDIKVSAFEKIINEPRYFSEGSLFTPFILTLEPKKKNIEFIEKGLEFLLKFLDEKKENETDKEIADYFGHIIISLNDYLKKEGNVDFLKVLFDLTVFKEEIKKPKKKKPKKGEIQEEPEIKENPVYASIRLLSMEILYKIQKGLNRNITENKDILISLSKIPEIVETTMKTINQVSIDLKQIHENNSQKAKVVQLAVYILPVLVNGLRYNLESNISILFAQEFGISSFHDLASEEILRLNVIQLFDLISQSKEGFSLFWKVNNEVNVPEPEPRSLPQESKGSNGPEDEDQGAYESKSNGVDEKEIAKEEISSSVPPPELIKGLFEGLLHFYSLSHHVLSSSADILTGTNGKGTKDSKKDNAKGKKGAANAEPDDFKELLKMERLDNDRVHSAIIMSLSSVFTKFAQYLHQNKSNNQAIKGLLFVDSFQELFSMSSKLILNKTIWKVIQDHSLEPFDEPMDRVLDKICIMLGNFALINSDLKSSLIAADSLNSLLDLLIDSKGLVDFKGLQALRRVCEKAIFNIISIPVSAKKELESLQQPPISLSGRWASAKSFSSNLAIFECPESKFIEKMTQVLESVEDLDIVGRGLRILSCLVSSSTSTSLGTDGSSPLDDQNELSPETSNNLSLADELYGDWSHCQKYLVSSKFDTHIISRLNKLSIEFLGDSLSKIRDLESLSLPKETLGLEVPCNEQEEEAGNSDGLIDPVNNETETQEREVEAAEKENPDLLYVDCFVNIYHLFSLVESLLRLNPENVTHFAQKESLQLMSSFLFKAGPTCNSRNKSLESHHEVKEKVVHIFDPRLHDWVKENDVDIPKDAYLVRPLIIDTLSYIASSSKQYKTYDAEIPPDPEVDIPSFTSECENAALAVSRYCADACCAILSSRAVFVSKDGRLSFQVLPYSENSSISIKTIDAALWFFYHVGTIGATGLAGILESIADAAFKTPTDDSGEHYSMRPLCEFFAASEKLSPTEMVDDQVMSLRQSEWKRPNYFNDLIPSDIDASQAFNLVDLSTRSILWPFLTLSFSLLSVISDPEYPAQTLEIALHALSSCCYEKALHDHSQPVLVDGMLASLLALGGLSSLFGSIGHFGSLSLEIKEQLVEFSCFLIQRGHRRETFWSQWYEKKNSAAAQDAKPGKGSKKDDKKGKDNKKVDPKGQSSLAAAVEKIELNLESGDPELPDPNHGPNQQTWKLLLEIPGHDLHSQNSRTSPLISAILGRLDSLALALIEQGVDLDQNDSYLMTPLMYSLLINSESITKSLLSNGADADIYDSLGNPTIKYATLSLSQQDLETYFIGYKSPHNPEEKQKQEELSLFGQSDLLPLVLSSKADINVRDQDGFSLIMHALGLAEAHLSLGGRSFHILNRSYNDPGYSKDQIMHSVELLLDAKVDPNACSKSGVTPLHVTASRGDQETYSILIENKADPNLIDQFGFHAIHYLCACCPENSPAFFDIIMQSSECRNAAASNYSDYRSGKPKEEKEENELSLFIDQYVSLALSPSILKQKRYFYSDILQWITKDNLNIIQLVLCGPTLLDNFLIVKGFLHDSKESRMNLCLRLLEVCSSQGILNSMLHNIGDKNLTIFHAASLLFKGMTPKQTLTEREKRSKRFKKYESQELHILDILFSNCHDIPPDTKCDILLPSLLNTSGWTPLHACVTYNNVDFFETLLSNISLKKQVIDLHLLHYIACFNSSESPIDTKILDILLGLYIDEPSPANEYDAVYGSTALHLCIQYGNLDLFKRLIENSRVDLNFISTESNGLTTLQYALFLKKLSIVECLIPYKDRLDFTVKSSTDSALEGKDCVEFIVENHDLEALNLLIEMRKNDVIECVTRIVDSKYSLLQSIEKKFIDLVQEVNEKYNILSYGESKSMESENQDLEEGGEVSNETKEPGVSSNAGEDSESPLIENVTNYFSLTDLKRPEDEKTFQILIQTLLKMIKLVKVSNLDEKVHFWKLNHIEDFLNYFS